MRSHHDFDVKRFTAATPQTQGGYGSFLGPPLDDIHVVVRVDERNGQVLGHACTGVEGTDYLLLRGPAGLLYDIILAHARRGAGVGRLLLDAALATRGAPRVVRSTAERTRAAQRLSPRARFRRTMIARTREWGEAPPTRLRRSRC